MDDSDSLTVVYGPPPPDRECLTGDEEPAGMELVAVKE